MVRFFYFRTHDSIKFNLKNHCVYINPKHHIYPGSDNLFSSYEITERLTIQTLIGISSKQYIQLA